MQLPLNLAIGCCYGWGIPPQPPRWLITPVFWIIASVRWSSHEIFPEYPWAKQKRVNKSHICSLYGTQSIIFGEGKFAVPPCAAHIANRNLNMWMLKRSEHQHGRNKESLSMEYTSILSMTEIFTISQYSQEHPWFTVSVIQSLHYQDYMRSVAQILILIVFFPYPNGSLQWPSLILLLLFNNPLCQSLLKPFIDKDTNCSKLASNSRLLS